MQEAKTRNECRALIQQWREQGHSIAFVPTMGNLHAGHMGLVADARESADKIIVSIFVNPTQFGPNEDFDRYPRTLAADRQKLDQAGVDALFLPGIEDIYPQGPDAAPLIDVGILGNILCGAVRPGHFSGMATVVDILLDIVAPDIAIFGKKDYQQLQIIRNLVRDRGYDIEIVGGRTERAESGLALSSRNQYLSSDERDTAAVIYQTLLHTGEALKAGDRDYRKLQRQGRQALLEYGLEPDYYSIMKQDLTEPTSETREWVILTAARLGKARLIDNICVP